MAADSALLRRLTEDRPGSGGRLTSDPEDFVVDEVLPYAPSGSGTHLFVRIEKRGLTTPMAIRRLLEGVDRSAIGYAGLKDRHAITRQWISVEDLSGSIESALADVDDVRVLETARHERKLKRGHVRANRFQIVLRDVDDPAAAIATFEHLVVNGVPNYFGPQRFGRDGDNHERAARILRGEERPPRRRDERSILFSAFQSNIFNILLSERIARGWYTKALRGDVMKKRETGGLFVVDDAAAETIRVEAMEISPTGPILGKKTMPSQHEARAFEEEVEAPFGLDAAKLARLGPGTRRVMRLFLGEEATIEALDDNAVRLAFSLPSGAYATVVLDEVVKPDEAFTREPPSRPAPAFGN